MKKNLLLIGALAALCVFVWLLRPWERRPQQQAVPTLQQQVIKLELEKLNALTEMEAAQDAATKLMLEVDSLKHANTQLQQHHGRQLAELRKKPPVPVTTTNIRMAECDSAMDVGQSLLAENEKQYAAIGELHTALDACQEAHSIRDSASLLRDQAQLQLQEQLAKTQSKLEKQKGRTKFWQGTTLVLVFNEVRRLF